VPAVTKVHTDESRLDNPHTASEHVSTKPTVDATTPSSSRTRRKHLAKKWVTPIVDIADAALIKFDSASDSDDYPLPYAPYAGWEMVHVLKTVDGRVIHMFVDVSYPLSAATLQRMLKHGLEVPKLLVGGDLTMAEQLVRFIKVTQNCMVFTFHVPFWNDKWLVQGGTTLELASPEQTATGKDVSNPFMAVMVCQKPLGYFSSPLIHVPRAGLVINPPG
nr:late embryogenesis abundant protein, LEA-14 [Tanacetum cinerariifolium]